MACERRFAAVLTRGQLDLMLALGLPGGQSLSIVFVLITVWGNFVCFHRSHLLFTASTFLSFSRCMLEVLRSFPSSFLRSHRRRHRTAMGKPKKASTMVGTSAAAGGKKGTAATRVTDGGWR